MFKGGIVMSVVNIYTDGACSGNQNTDNFGGWGAILEYGPHKKEIYDGEINTTNNRMEMMALLKAFQSLKKEQLTIRVFSDSSYLMDCFRDKWYEKWLCNNWMTASKKPVENQDLWMELIPFINKHTISFYRVKGHLNLDHPSTNIQKWFDKFREWNGQQFSMDDFKYITSMNHRADALANLGIDKVKNI